MILTFTATLYVNLFLYFSSFVTLPQKYQLKLIRETDLIGYRSSTIHHVSWWCNHFSSAHFSFNHYTAIWPVFHFPWCLPVYILPTHTHTHLSIMVLYCTLRLSLLYDYKPSILSHSIALKKRTVRLNPSHSSSQSEVMLQSFHVFSPSTRQQKWNRASAPKNRKEESKKSAWLRWLLNISHLRRWILTVPNLFVLHLTSE